LRIAGAAVGGVQGAEGAACNAVIVREVLRVLDVATGQPVRALGLMSGTSLDGIDAAVVETDGETVAALGPALNLPYDAAYAGRLRAAFGWSPAEAVEAELDARHAAAVRALAAAPALVGYHGQTVAHAPAEGRTRQLGRGDRLAAALGLPVVWDFRTADMAAGGEGAPLVPFFHHACARRAGLALPVAFLNIGGVANVTWLDPSRPDPVGACLAFDTGPGNALLNDWMQRRTGAALDRDGAAAAAGRVRRERLGAARVAAYLDRHPPKSLDRDAFAAILGAMEGLPVEDGAATLTALTADCIAAALRHLPAPPARWLVCGGGRHNRTLMRMLGARLPGVEPVEAIGLDGDMLEAQAFAFLAVRVLRGLPTSAPATTGCRAPVCGGRISYP
jgi:anhydro-N-acetylmuramic acid kinase